MKKEKGEKGKKVLENRNFSKNKKNIKFKIKKLRFFT